MGVVSGPNGCSTISIAGEDRHYRFAVATLKDGKLARISEQFMGLDQAAEHALGLSALQDGIQGCGIVVIVPQAVEPLDVPAS